MRYLIVPLVFIFSPFIWAEDSAPYPCKKGYSAKLVALQGSVSFEASGESQWQAAHLDQALCEGSQIQVQNNSRASLLLPSGVTLTLKEGTLFVIKVIKPDEPTTLNLIKGFIHFISRTPRKLEVITPIANAGPEGTEFAMSVDENKAALWVYEGAVKLANNQGSIHLSQGEGGQALAGQAPQAKIDIKPQDAVNWALYYPPVLAYPDASANIDSDLRLAIQTFRQGHIDRALSQMEKLPLSRQTPYYQQVKAAMHLTAGQDQIARQAIQTLLAKNPNDAEALALNAVLQLTQNHKDEAYALAKQAITANPQSASAYAALSYSEQSRFQLTNAQAAADQAAKLAPHDALVWARKAELELSQGLTSASQKSAEQAIARDANLERTQTVLGFSYLLQMETDSALETFNKAIQFDSTSPLARLGLGLAKIRQGNLAEGRQDLETAAILDPNNSIVRSYLGKAYYEERRSPLADEQFRLAKDRDPKDPTPYFYDAINKQTTNRPVEALQDMQKAIELNDNRGVYRSSLLLDKDLAARSAAQGRIYNDLGFQRLGLLEGWKSVNNDPSNYSAHRLLADNYASQPRHEIARVSELLQSQLLQPLNITPVQPQLAQSNILIVDGLGPSSLSFNEFNPLFARNRFAVQASGIYGSNNTWGEDVVHSGLWDKGSYSLGQFHYNTDGFRQNNFLKQDIYNAFVQGDISDSLNLQAEYRHEERENGDLSFNFNRDNFSSSFRENRTIDNYRLGGRYLFSANSSLIASLIYQNINIFQKQNTQIFFPDDNGIFLEQTIVNGFHTKRKGFISELQHQYSNSKLNLISGFGHIDQSVNQLDLGFTPDDPGVQSKPDISRTNVYSYIYLKNIHNLQTTLGISYDHLKIESSTLEKNTINPKFGLVWSPSPLTTFRTAFFRYMNVSRTSSQTIEPTQISGFNQLFDDPNGTLSWRYGVAIDHKFSNYFFSGLEYSERKLDVPINNTSVNWNEQLGRAYFYLSPNKLISLSAEYLYEENDRHENPFNTGIINVKTHRVPLTINVLHPNGFSFSLKSTYVHQSGEFEKIDNFDGNSSFTAKSDFVIFDLNLNYRFPLRYGFVSFGIKNLFDKKYKFQSNNSFLGSNSNESFFAPDRTLFTQIKLAF